MKNPTRSRLENVCVFCMVDPNVKYKRFHYGSDSMVGLKFSTFWHFGTDGFMNVDCVHILHYNMEMLYELGL